MLLKKLNKKVREQELQGMVVAKRKGIKREERRSDPASQVHTKPELNAKTETKFINLADRSDTHLVLRILVKIQL